MKTILYLSYFYYPDLSAGSFRNTALSKMLSKKLSGDTRIHLVCTQPNRYYNVETKLPSVEHLGNLTIHRIDVPQHKNKFLKQVISFYYYQRGVWKIIKELNLSFIFASTSKIFTGYLAYRIASVRKVPYYIDLRDLFSENIAELELFPFFNKFLSKWIYKNIERPTLMNAAHININSDGFRSSLPKEFKGTISFYPNGIDDEFIGWNQDPSLGRSKMVVCYAGNIGEAQGLHRLIPELAVSLKESHRFIIIGDGSAKHKLQNEIVRLKLKNVKLIPPVKRTMLLDYYRTAHYLLLHLNDYKSFEKVLPSKIFEYAGGNIPILAGVSGYAKTFLETEVKQNCYIFKPCDVGMIRNYLELNLYSTQSRTEFSEKYSRENITNQMANSILSTIQKFNG
ncbi:MAG: glycosyltransferase family 4 protein [Saprospiraceae bacterium]|nr:glycosyltransferase family 4 protein [Saprospiraceae bacterium]